MTDRADVIRMARDQYCRIEFESGNVHEGYEFCLDELEAYTELVRAVEREKWAKVAEKSVNCLNLAVAMRVNKVS